MIPARYSPRPLRTLVRAGLGHLRASAGSAFWPVVVWAGLLLGVWLTRHYYVAWDGIQTIGGVR